jgi:pyruvate formate lyase activating enzyme
MAGREIGVEELVREIERDVLLFDNSGGGVTFSGGEPLFQPTFLRESLVRCRARGIRTALETSGQASPETFESIIDYVDLFLFDLKLLDDDEHRKYTGVSNSVIKRNLITLVTRKRGKDVILRFPVVTGINDTENNVEEFLGFVRGLDGIRRVDLLPYHDVSEKYRRLGLRYQMNSCAAPSEEKLNQIKESLRQGGLEVRVRG